LLTKLRLFIIEVCCRMNKCAFILKAPLSAP
jgi:hypothetical protein